MSGAEIRTEECYEAGVSLLEGGRAQEAFEHLSRAYHSDPKSARYRSSYALALALAKGEFLAAADLARTAVQQEFYNPDLYMNLAKIYLIHGFKAEAVRILRRATMVDPDNERILGELASLGVRRRPIIPFLPREHRLNRALGKLFSRTLTSFGAFASRCSRA